MGTLGAIAALVSPGKQNMLPGVLAGGWAFAFPVGGKLMLGADELTGGAGVGAAWAWTGATNVG